jgi:hypothetical protein
MHLSFDLYPSYLKRFTDDFRATSPSRLSYQIHAMRNYEYRNENGKRTGPYPQVRSEGSLELQTRKPNLKGIRSIQVRHIRSWSTWTNQKHSSAQTIEALIQYESNPYGTPLQWNMRYRSDPVLPTKSYRFSASEPFRQKGTVNDGKIEIRGESANNAPATYQHTQALTTFYTLIERLQYGAIKVGKVDYLDDLTMFRPGMQLIQLPNESIEIEGSMTDLHGYALVGPAILPLYFWMDSASRVLAAIGRNVAYTLTSAHND